MTLETIGGAIPTHNASTAGASSGINGNQGSGEGVHGHNDHDIISSLTMEALLIITNSNNIGGEDDEESSSAIKALLAYEMMQAVQEGLQQGAGMIGGGSTQLATGGAVSA